MVAGSILPVCIHKNKLYFLFGKENDKEKDAKGWSDFGGGCEPHETPYQTALREGHEESSGFLQPKDLVKKGVYKLTHDTYHMFIVKLDYNEDIPLYFNRMHQFIQEKMPHLLKTVLFEKQELQWFSIDEVIQRRSEFRSFYQKITDHIVAHKQHIIRFIKSSKTRKNKNVL
jgi:8-oxo-dGTP pyrophosphatase MutT (NUDIX family)